MVCIFYNKNTMNDTMTINLVPENFTRIENVKQGTLLYNEDKFIGMNIFDVSKSIQIEEGYLYLNKKIADFVLNKFNIDLIEYHTKKFIVGEVLKTEQVENSNLKKCIVDIKTELLQIVCGAENVEQGKKVVVALTNTVMPNGKVIVPTRIMGIESTGMICSRKELWNFGENSGILILDDKYEKGQEFIDHYANVKKNIK
ncbi:MAG: YtpR family tRNA-binding protein [Mycoplasmoidaceae bacterium]